ncbi:MAG: hypothetical protein ABSA05_14635 [Opitutaceae bacterium]|jgi:hypothetical protein
MEGGPVKIGWLLGWAVPERWFEAFARGAFPSASHLFERPSPGAIDRLEARAPFDWVVGYSLGTLLLIGQAPRADRLGRIALLAPIFAFPSEEGLGGRIPRAEVRVLARGLRQDPLRAIGEFYSRAGLERVPGVRVAAPLAAGPLALGTDPWATSDEGRLSLAWGLAQLENVRLDPILPEGWAGWCGEDDPLLDARRLHELARAITPLKGATHHPLALIRAFAASVGGGPGRVSAKRAPA